MDAPGDKTARTPYAMPAHRRLLAWLVTDRVGQSMAMTVMFAWAVSLYVRGRLRGGKPKG